MADTEIDRVIANVRAAWQAFQHDPTTAAAAAILGGLATWAAAHWSYKARLTTRDDQIAALKADRDRLTEEVRDLRAKVANAPAAPKDPDAVFQFGRMIGKAISVAPAPGGLLIGAMTVTDEFVEAEAFTFRDYVLRFVSYERRMERRSGVQADVSFGNVQCTIEGRTNA